MTVRGTNEREAIRFKVSCGIITDLPGRPQNRHLPSITVGERAWILLRNERTDENLACSQKHRKVENCRPFREDPG